MDEEPVNWKAWAEMDPTVADMISARIPMTRENYISAKYGELGTMDHPAEWTQEHENDLPQPFQR